MATQTRLELFNEMFLLIMQQLLDNVPGETDIDPTKVAEEMCVIVTEERRKLGNTRSPSHAGAGFGPLPTAGSFYELFVSTIEFMDDEGFLRRPNQFTIGRTFVPSAHCAITEKGISAMNIPMPGRNATVGQTIQAIAKESAGDARRSLISETVGIVIGAAAKGFLGGGTNGVAP